MSENAELPDDIVQAEAKIITSVTEPIAKETVKSAATPGSPFEKALPFLGGTANIELGSQLLDQIRQERPALYDALVTREKTFVGLVQALIPGYIDFKEEQHLTPTEGGIRAAAAPEETRRKALESARLTATTIVSRVVEKIESAKHSPGAYPYAEDFVAATNAVKAELEGKHGYTVIEESHIEATTSLLGCVMASVKANRMLKNLRLDLKFDLGTALDKQLRFNERRGVVKKAPA